MRRTLLLILLLTTHAAAQQPPNTADKQAGGKLASFALSADQQKELLQAYQLLQQRERDRNGALDLVLQVELEPGKCLEAVARAQLAQERLNSANVAFNEMRKRHQAAVGCPECDYAPDGKSMQRPNTGTGPRDTSKESGKNN